MTIIGITVDSDLNSARYCLNQAYVAGVILANGVPFLIPHIVRKEEINSMLSYLDGIIFSGGGDPDPIFFAQEPEQNCGEINPLRDKFELLLAKECLKRQIPVLGICRGCQILNIAAGGNIHQDILHISKIKHYQQAPRWHSTHYVTIKEQTMLRKIIKAEKIRVNSIHHQAIKKVAATFITSATANDQIVEAIESRNSYAIGVQWHPEELLHSHGKNLFTSLLEAAKKDD